MSGLPTITVKLDDGTGTYPTDITSSVRLVEGITVSGYGRSDEQATQPATLTLTLDNSSGSFTTSGLGFGLGPFGGGPFGGAGSGVTVYPGQGIRLTLTKGATTRDRFTGRVATLAQGWPSGGDEFSTLILTAVDGLAALGRKKLRSMLEQEILLRSPSAYYTLGEATGSTSAGDTSGSQAPPLTIAGSGSALTFASGTGPGTDGLTATQFFGGQYLTAPSPAVPTRWAIGVWFKASATGSQQTIVSTGKSQATIYLDATGHLLVGSSPPSTPPLFTSATVVADGSTHFVAIDSFLGNAYIDGALVGTGATVLPSLPASTLTVGAYTDGTTPLTGTVSHVMLNGGLTAAQVSAIYNAGVGATETTAARFARIASYAGVTTTATAGTSGQLMGAQSTSGVTASDALQAVALAEGAPAYVNGTGVLTLQGRGLRAAETTPSITLAAIEAVPDVQVTYDTQQIVNTVTVTRTGGATQIAKNAASIATNDAYETSLDLGVADDTSALGAAQWIVATHGSPTQRLASATLDLLSSAVSDTILARDIGDRILLSPMPSQMWTGAGDVTVEGWTETITTTAWTLTANLLPWSLFTALVLDDATYGALDSYPIAN